MSVPVIPGTQSFAVTPPATAFGTVVVSVIPPAPGRNGCPLLYSTKPGSGGAGNWTDQPYTHITDLVVTCSTTANIIYIMRPLGWTTFSAAVAKNTTAISLTDDPGAFATTYRYPVPGAAPVGLGGAGVPCVANNTLAANDYVAFQLADGRWVVDKIASGTVAGANVVLTTGTPNVTGATVAAGQPLFFFGINTDTVPATGTVHLIRTPIISTQQVNLLAGWGGNASAVGGGGGASSGNGVPSLFPGDPLLVYNPNATATTTVDFIGGDYRKY